MCTDICLLRLSDYEKSIQMSFFVKANIMFSLNPIFIFCTRQIFLYKIVEEWQNYINFSGTLLVLAPHQFSQQHKTSSKTSFTTTTEISHFRSLALPSSTQQLVTNSFNQPNQTEMDDSVTEDNNHKIPHSLDSENERVCFNEPETTLRLTVPDLNIISKSELNQRKGNKSEEKESEDETEVKTRTKEFDEDNRQQSTCSTLILFLLGLLLSFLCLVFGNHYFAPDDRCQTFGMRMDWNSGPPPT